MKYLLSCLLLVISTTIMAQKLSVDSFTENPRDLSASTNLRKDLNGNACALVKVQLASDGAQFEGNIIGDVAYKTSEYWTYMVNGSKRLKIKLEGYLPLDVEFADYGIRQLEPKITYVLTISGVVSNGQPQEVRTKTGWIILDSEPQGAAVYINGEYVGNTPLDSYKQPYGTYEYKLEKPNYHSVVGSLDLNSAQFEKTVKLSPAFGSISVTSNISGASVSLDGKSTGKSAPCTLEEIPSGSHTISLNKDKYAPRQYTITVEDGKETTVEGNLDARFASVTIKSLDGADILIDGSSKGTGNCTLDLMEGYYDIETKLAHHRKTTRQVQVVAGQTQTITLNPTPIYGSLDITSTPRKANITIDGKLYGQTPYTVEQLLEGSHSVTFSLDGYASETMDVAINDGQTAIVSATLQSGRSITITTKEPGATILLDGIEVGTSLYTGILAFGKHTTYAMLNGDKSEEATITSELDMDVLEPITLSVFGNKTFNVKGVSFTMVAVEEGTFTMGATKEQKDNAYPDEKPMHNVTISSYLIGETEVTQALWKAVMGSNPSQFKGDNLPVERVSWNDCQEFIQKLNTLTGASFRLPTEAEWEYATRGGCKSSGYKYSGSDNIEDVAWYKNNSFNSTHKVKTKLPNELGIYDMSGNVWEWCSDWYGKYSKRSQVNPIGSTKGSRRIGRGGGWFNDAGGCRSTFRNSDNPDYRGNLQGFRLALSK